MSTEFKGTKGKWAGYLIGEYGKRAKINNGNIEVWALDNVTTEEANANAQLIIDAGNTIQSCGLLPSELLKQRDELRRMLENIYQIEDSAFGLKSFNVEDLKRKIKRVLESTEVKAV